ncbi:hypothetical protein, partial [Maricaulis sp.]|uniref:hypothetical protein n=1 Tax=Maricaulis sp. TaxID=1486257 RepID=UPI00261CBCB7
MILPVVCIVIVGLFLTLGAALRAQSERSASLRQAASIQADNLARLIETRIEQDGAAIERMGARITARNAPISEAEWRADATAYLHDKAWLEALYWVDADGVRWAEPQDAPAITAVIGGRTPFGDDRAEAGPVANRLNIGATVQYAEGRPGLVGYYTFARPDSGVGVLVTIHDVVTMLQLAERAAHASGHDLALTVPGSSAPLVGHSDTVAGRQGVAAVAPIGVYDVNWRLHIAPSEVLLAGFRRYAVLGNVLAGLALTAMGATLAFLVQNARRQTAELEAAQETRQISEQRYNRVG